jgi:hypothetical protein
MPTNYYVQKPKKVKVGTVLDEEVFRRLKLLSEKEGRPISALIQDALLKYELTDPVRSELRLKAFDQFLSTRFNIPDEDWQAIMEEDYYDQ